MAAPVPSRRVVALAYAAIVVTDTSTAVFLPVAPTFAADFALTKLETGALFAITSLGLAALSIPVGLAADRVGARRLTAAGVGLLAASLFAQGFAADFWMLLAARAANGVAYALVWTAALVWLADSVSPGRRSAALGGSITLASAGWIVASLASGFLADHVGRPTPFVVLGALACAVLAAILAGEPGGRAVHGHEPLRATLGAVRRDVLVLGAVVVMVIDALGNRLITLLAPLQLAANGVSAGAIGALYALTAALAVAAGALTNRAGERPVRLDVAGVATAALGGLVVLFALGTGTAVVVAALVATTPLFTLLITITYPLGAAGAARVGVGRGAVLGLLNVVSGAAAVVGPVAGGALAGAAGDRVAYAALAALTIATGIGLLAAARRTAVREGHVPVPGTRP